MSKTYVVRNQSGQYVTRKGEWISGRETTAVAHFVHHDQAVNQLFELGIKDIYLRGRVEEVALNEAGKPVLNDFGPEPVVETVSETVQSVVFSEAAI
jgi:hypothetical protein